MSARVVLLWVGCFVSLLVLFVLVSIVWSLLPSVVQVPISVVAVALWATTVYRRVDRR